jgi:hypothetical protein
MVLILLFIFFSNPIRSETFELVCDIKLEPLTQARYRFDTESKIVTEMGFYTGSKYSNKTPLDFKTIAWDLDKDMLIWVSNYSEFSGSNNKIFDILVFDLYGMYITFARSSSKNGLIEHVIDFTKSCIRE